jgi:Mrp family chromosome partitioning ATPase
LIRAAASDCRDSIEFPPLWASDRVVSRWNNAGTRMLGAAIPRRIALLNEKGGSAKTTLVANLGAYLALHRGRRVLAIDMDPQGQLGKVLGIDTRRARHSAIELLLDTVLGDASLDRERSGAPLRRAFRTSTWWSQPRRSVWRPPSSATTPTRPVA